MGDVIMALLQRPAALPLRAEPLLQAQLANRVLPALAKANDVAEVGEKTRPAERRQRHYLIFITGVQKSEILGDALVKHPERVRHVTLPEPLQPVPAADGVAGSRLLAAAVQGHDG